ncbi:MAG: endonuclease VIII [Saccharofermentanales bacterium]
MIEIPESNTLARQINATLIGRSIQKVIANHSPHKFAWFSGNPDDYNNLFSGKVIISAIANGGMAEILADDIRLIFCDGTNVRYFGKDDKIPEKHQLYMKFDDQSSIICSVQMYGAIWALREGQIEGYNEIAKSKVSPLSDEFDKNYFDSLFEKSKDGKLSAKAFLATKQRIPGLGNGVLQDILFNARIHPKHKMNSISDSEYESLYNSVKNTLADMTAKGGRDTEKDLFGNNGGYETILSSKTKGTPCPVCGGMIQQEAYLGGNIYFCPNCQKL